MSNETHKSGQVVAILYLGISLLGLALCLFTLAEMWDYRPMLHLMLSRNPVIKLLGIGGLVPMWGLFALIGLFTLAGVVSTASAFLALRSSEARPDLAPRLRGAVYLAMGCLLVCVFVLSTPESFSGPFRLRHPIAGWIAASIAYGLWWVLPQLRLGLSDRMLKGIDVVAMNLTLMLVFAELALRGAAMVVASPLLVTDSTSSQIRRQSERRPPGEIRLSFPVNSQGFYDTEFLPKSERSRPVVVTIGDSFSYGVVPHHFHYTTVAERAFPEAEIYNIGFPGTNPTDYLYHVTEDALPLEPDLIIISLFLGNDLSPELPAAEPIRWYDAERYLVGVVWHRLGILRAAKANDWTRSEEANASDDLIESYPWLADPTLEPPSLGKDIYHELTARNAYLGAANLPGVYERFFAALERIEDAAGDTPLAFMLIPDEYQVNDALWDIVLEKNELPLTRSLPQQKILQWAEGRRTVLDLLPLMLAVPPMPDGERHLYHRHDGHFNARGNEVAGRALAGLIAQHFSTPFEADATLPISVSTAVSMMPLDEATQVVKDFGALIGQLGLDGKSVYEQSVLGRSKQEIKTAIVTVLKGGVPAQQPEFYQELAAILAFFQEGVGEGGVALDAIREGGSTWRETVEAEMRENVLYVVSRSQQ